ncbi:Autolysis response regulater LytR [hydrothermal vent metagenome]|uniref:Autolysis response regulater LytR n=1 Tax=hydrothermal vent metagenome TaxID=652676 RepID=A0A3B0XWD5_9ZZZZ
MNIMIVDDEPLARQRLMGLVQELNGFDVCANASNGKDALRLAQELKPDVVLLDIRMPGMDGIETAHHMNRLSKPPAIIFTTAFSEHALSAFQTHAVDYLLKPIKQDKLADALRASSRLTKPQLEQLKHIDDKPKVRTHICVKTRGALELVPIGSIRYFMADHKYVTLRTDDHECLIEESLKSLENEFCHLFTRIHRNALIADQYMNGLEKNTDGHCVITIDSIDERLEISRRHLPHVRKKLKNLSTYK